jgi:GAF domain-containing protein
MNSDDLARRLAEMARTLLGRRSVQETLASVVRFAVEIVEGCDHAGIVTARRGAGLITAAATDDVVRQSDALQERFREGPCYDVLWRQSTILVPDLAAENLWPRYRLEAMKLGVCGFLGFQLSVDEDHLGALNLFSSQPHVLGKRSQQVGAVFASQAAVAMARARTEAQLHEAIETREVVAEACGILRERYGLSAAEALDQLSRTSQNLNVKMYKLAEQITRTGRDPLRLRRRYR